MAIQEIDILKEFFEAGDKPTQENFSDLMDSYWHKNEGIPIGKIEGLKSALDAKQATLKSGVNIKTINAQSILGAGDLFISSGSLIKDAYVFEMEQKEEDFLWISQINQPDQRPIEVRTEMCDIGGVRILSAVFMFDQLSQINGFRFKFGRNRVSNGLSAFGGSFPVSCTMTDGARIECMTVSDMFSEMVISSQSSISGFCSLNITIIGS